MGSVHLAAGRETREQKPPTDGARETSVGNEISKYSGVSNIPWHLSRTISPSLLSQLLPEVLEVLGFSSPPFLFLFCFLSGKTHGKKQLFLPHICILDRRDQKRRRRRAGRGARELARSRWYHEGTNPIRHGSVAARQSYSRASPSSKGVYLLI